MTKFHVPTGAQIAMQDPSKVSASIIIIIMQVLQVCCGHCCASTGATPPCSQQSPEEQEQEQNHCLAQVQVHQEEQYLRAAAVLQECPWDHSRLDMQVHVHQEEQYLRAAAVLQECPWDHSRLDMQVQVHQEEQHLRTAAMLQECPWDHSRLDTQVQVQDGEAHQFQCSKFAAKSGPRAALPSWDWQHQLQEASRPSCQERRSQQARAAPATHSAATWCTRWRGGAETL